MQLLSVPRCCLPACARRPAQPLWLGQTRAEPFIGVCRTLRSLLELIVSINQLLNK